MAMSALGAAKKAAAQKSLPSDPTTWTPEQLATAKANMDNFDPRIKAAEKALTEGVKKKEEEAAKAAEVDKGIAATTYQNNVDELLDPVAQDFAAFGQQAQVTSNVDPAFRQYQLGLAQQLQAQANGEGPSLAQLQLKQATDQTMNQSLGAIRSATGANAGLSARTAALSAAQGLGNMGAQSGILRLQEQQQAQQMLAGVAGQGRAGDLDTNDASIQAQTATNQFKLGAIQGVGGIRQQQAAPSETIFTNNAVDVRQDKQIKADAQAAAIAAEAQRAAQRRAARQANNSQIMGTVLTTGATILGGMYGGPVGATAANKVVGGVTNNGQGSKPGQ